MAQRHSDEFKRDAARIALTSGLTRRQVSADLGVGLSTLNKWVKAFSEEAAPAGPDQNLVRENDRLRRENRILKEEREVLKNAAIR
ncbi:MAG: transposase [Paracoccaceae bacterium]|jgi:transposase